MTDPRTARQRTPEQQASIETSLEVVRTIDSLAKNEDFRRFMERFSRRADSLADQILHDEMKPKQREKLRQRRLGILEILLAPKQDREAQVRNLKQYGIQPGDPEE